MSMQRRRSRIARHKRSLNVETLETRTLLAADLSQPLAPIEGVETSQSQVAAPISVNFTDTVSGGGGSVGLDPNSDDFDAYDQGNFTPGLTPVVFNTSGAVPSFSGGGYSGTGTVVTANTGSGNYEIAVFVFD